MDGVTEAMITEGLNPMDNGDIARWLRRLLRRLSDRGAAVVAVDHVTKNADGNRRFALGAQHKLAGLSGAAYVFNVQSRLARAVSEPTGGRVKVEVSKDRPGHVRAHANGDVITYMVATSYPDGGMKVTLELPTAENVKPDLRLRAAIVRHLVPYDGASKSAIEEAVEGKATNIRAALASMAEQGWVEVRQEGNAHRRYLTDEGRSHVEPID